MCQLCGSSPIIYRIIFQLCESFVFRLIYVYTLTTVEMKKKIVITGALGYLGAELCKLYSGVSRHEEIIAIDERFVPQIVSQLRNWNIKFVQRPT